MEEVHFQLLQFHMFLEAIEFLETKTGRGQYQYST